MNTKKYMLITCLLTLCLIVTFNEAFAGCTTGVAIGNAVTDGRPLVWRNFDWHGNVVLLHCTEGRYHYLAPSPNNSSKSGGTNEVGLAIYTTLMKQMNPKGTASAAKHSVSWLLGHCKSVSEVSKAIQEQIRFEKGEQGGVRHWDSSKQAPALSAVVIDAYGNGAIFELGKLQSFEYNLKNATRLKAKPLQIGVRANQPHLRKDHLDNARTGGNRYTEARKNLTRLAFDTDKLTIEELMSGVARFGNPGFKPYQNCNYRTIGSTIVWGVKSGENPKLTVVLASLGNPDYSIYLPAWPAASDAMNKRLTSQSNDGIAWQVKQLLKKKENKDYDEI